MATLQQVLYKVSDDQGGFINRGWDTTQSFFGQELFQDKQVSKLSIQAPANTVALINNREIIIGNSGIYDLTVENAQVTSLKFPGQQEPDQQRIAELEAELQDQEDALSAAAGQGYEEFSNAVLTAINVSGIEDLARDYLAEIHKSTHGNPPTLESVIVNYIMVQEASN